MNNRTSDRSRRVAVLAAVVLISAVLLLGSTCNLLNKAPSVPVVTGPSAGVVGVPVTFTVFASDPDGDSVAYQFDWGDSSAAVWTAFFASGETTAVEHIYADSGTFAVRAKVKDAKDKESDWSGPLACQVATVQFSWPDSLIGEIQLEYDTDALLVTPDGRSMYVTHRVAGYVTPVRLADRAVQAPVFIGGGPLYMAATPDARYVYVTCVADSVVAVLRTSDNAVVARVWVGLQPKGIAVAQDGLHAYAATFDNTLAVIRTQDNQLVDTIGLGFTPDFVAAAPDGQRLFVTAVTTHVVGAVSIAQRALVDSVTVGLFPAQFDMSSDGQLLYVANQTDSGIAVIRSSDMTVQARVRLAERRVGDVTIAPSGDYLLGSYWHGIKCVALPTHAVVDSAPYGERGAMSFSTNGESLYVSDYRKVFVLGKRR